MFCLAWEGFSVIRSSPLRWYSYIAVLYSLKVLDCKVELSADRADATPAVFTKIQLHFVIQGENISEQHVARAVQLSAEKYCSASKMLEAGGVEITHSFEIQAVSI
jgi:putative redox protein